MAELRHGVHATAYACGGTWRRGGSRATPHIGRRGELSRDRLPKWKKNGQTGFRSRLPVFRRLTDSDRHEDSRVATLHEQRNVALRLLDRAAQVIDTRDRRTIGSEHHVSRLQPRFRRTAAHLLDQQTVVRVGFALLVAVQRTYRETELIVLALLGVQSSGLVLHGPELDADIARRVVAPDLQRYRGSGGHGGNLHRQLRGALLQGMSVELQDDIARLDSRALRRPALLDAGDERAFRLRQSEGIREPLGDGLDHDTELAAADVAGRFELLGHMHGDVDRDRE